MAEAKLKDEKNEVVISNLKKDTPLNKLMNAIKDGDISKCKEIVQQLKPRMLNCKVRLKYANFNGFCVTPLIWAVMNRHYGIVEVLLNTHADVHKVGYYESNSSVYSFNSLLRAVENSDPRMMELLLEHGADPQKGVPGVKSSEEEGGTIQYLKWIYPLNFSFTSGMHVYKSLLKYADMGLEYGENSHTCLCYALNCIMKMRLDRSCVSAKVVIQHGGRLCRGQRGGSPEINYRVVHEKKLCSYFHEFIRATAAVYFTASGEKRFSGSKMYYNCLKLISCTEYAHEQSQVYRSFKHYAEGLAAVDLSSVNVPHENQILECLQWISDYAKKPSSLRHIARVTIRQCMKSANIENCNTLPLPAKLISYVSFVDVDDTGFTE